MLLELRQVGLRYGRQHALRGIDLRVARGERIALIGGNGSGKSSLLRVLHGLQHPTEGAMSCDTSARQAMVFQRPYVLRGTALQNVELGPRLAGTAANEARQRALQALARVGLAHEAMRPARALSSGQQQRLALARAWSLSPEILFLDEPTSNLDPHGKREVENLMANFGDQGMTLVFASHNLGQVKRLATRVAYLEHGRLLADLPVHRFFDREALEACSREAALFLKGELA